MEGYCSICRKRLGMFVSYADLRDGAICSDCIKKAGFDYNNDDDITYLENMTVEEIADKIAFIEQNRFRPNTVCRNISFDDDKRVFMIYENGNEYYYNYENLVSYEFLKDDKPAVGRAVGGAMLGAMLGSLPGMIIGGALAGGLFGKYTNSLTIRFVTNDKGIREHYIELLNERTSEESVEYKKAEADAYRIVNSFENALRPGKENDYESEPVRMTQTKLDLDQQQNKQETVRKAEPEIKVEPDKKTNSVAEEILKYKELLDMGAITKEEFDNVKKRLLGL